MDDGSRRQEGESPERDRDEPRGPWRRALEAILLRRAIAASQATEDGRDADAARTLRELRSRRVFALVLSLVIAGLGVKQGARALWPPADLAAGKPWRTSSTYAGLDTRRHLVDGLPTDIIVHTNKEPNPWVEIDLQGTHEITSVEVRNRIDYGADRAIPLAVQVRADGGTWREVVRTEQVFHTWTPHFDPVRVRFVRLQILKTTYLHFERIGVR